MYNRDKNPATFCPSSPRLFVPSPFTRSWAVPSTAPEHTAQGHPNPSITPTQLPPWTGMPVRGERGEGGVASRTFCPFLSSCRSSPLSPSTAAAHLPPLPHTGETLCPIYGREAKGIQGCVVAHCDMARNPLHPVGDRTTHSPRMRCLLGRRAAAPQPLLLGHVCPEPLHPAPPRRGLLRAVGVREGGEF